MQLLHRSVQYEGPIPDPIAMQGYESVHPGLADRIMRMAEQEQRHNEMRIRAAIDDARAERMEARLGQIFGFLIGMTAIITGGFVAVMVEGAAGATAGSILGGGGLATLVGVFVYGRKQSDNDEIAAKPQE